MRLRKFTWDGQPQTTRCCVSCAYHERNRVLIRWKETERGMDCIKDNRGLSGPGYGYYSSRTFTRVIPWVMFAQFRW